MTRAAGCLPVNYLIGYCYSYLSGRARKTFPDPLQAISPAGARSPYPVTVIQKILLLCSPAQFFITP